MLNQVIENNWQQYDLRIRYDSRYQNHTGTSIAHAQSEKQRGPFRPLFPENGFSHEEVNRHVKRSGHLCAMLEKNGVIVVASFVSPYAESRNFARKVARNFVEVYMKTTVEACEQRDNKGHYAKARSGEYKDFPGVDAHYDVPESPEITIEVDPPQPVVGDGETWGETPITATVLPSAVSVITPAE